MSEEDIQIDNYNPREGQLQDEDQELLEQDFQDNQLSQVEQGEMEGEGQISKKESTLGNLNTQNNPNLLDEVLKTEVEQSDVYFETYQDNGSPEIVGSKSQKNEVQDYNVYRESLKDKSFQNQINDQEVKKARKFIIQIPQARKVFAKSQVDLHYQNLLKNDKQEIQKQKLLIKNQVQKRRQTKIAYSYQPSSLENQSFQQSQSAIFQERSSSVIKIISPDGGQGSSQFFPKSQQLVPMPPSESPSKPRIINNIEEMQIVKKQHQLSPLITLQLIRPTRKNQSTLDCLTQLTNQQFLKSKAYIQFDRIDEQLKKNNNFFLFYVEDIQISNAMDLKVSNKLQLRTPIDPPLYFLEVQIDRKSLCLTTPKTFDKLKYELLDFLIKQSMIFLQTIEFKMWKKVNNNELPIGQANIEGDDLCDMTVIQSPHQSVVKAKQLTQNMKATENKSSKTIGQLTLKVISYGQTLGLSNQISQVPGSPKVQKLKKYLNLIERAKEKNEYKWPEIKENVILLDQIDQVRKKIVIFEVDVEKMKEKFELHKIDIIKQREAIIVGGKKVRAKKFGSIEIKKTIVHKQVRELIKTKKDVEDTLTPMRTHFFNNRVTKKELNGLKELGCAPVVLLLGVKDDIGLSLFDIMIMENNYSLFLDTFQDLEIKEQDDQSVEQFSESLFSHLIHQLKQKKRVEVIFELLRAIQNFPEMCAVIISIL